MLEHHAESGGNDLVVDSVHAERQHRAAPVDGLGHRRQLLQLHAAQHPDDLDEFGS
jgi:hypothetical protein